MISSADQNDSQEDHEDEQIPDDETKPLQASGLHKMEKHHVRSAVDATIAQIVGKISIWRHHGHPGRSRCTEEEWQEP